MTPPIDIRPDHLRIVRDVLRRHLPHGVTAWVFGSRADWKTKDSSDLDLALEGDTRLASKSLSAMETAFEESDLPYAVDIVDVNRIGDRFRKIVEKQRVRLPVNDHSGNGREQSALVENENQYAGAGRPTVTLGDCIEINDSTYSPKEAWLFVNYLDTGNITGNRISQIQHLVAGKDKIPSRARRKVRPGDIVYLTVRPNQRHFGILKQVPENFLASTGFSVIRGKDGFAHTDFIYWFLAQDQVVEKLHTIAEHSTSAYPSIKPSDIERLEIPLPPLREQRAIARILGTLDDKIELNRRMNETLEAMARALFRSWFVDFDPVRAKMAGRAPALPPALAALFPNRMVNSELGDAPEGWQVKALEDELSDLVSGQRPKGGAVNAGVPSIGAENVIGLGVYNYASEKYVPADFFARLRNKGADVRDGDVLLYKDGASIGRKTYFGCGFPHAECAVNEHVFILRLRDPEAQRYLFFWLDQPSMTQRIIALNSNSAQPGINKTGVRGLPLLLPPPGVLAAFDAQAGAATDKIFANCRESRKIAALRDILLPKLMSGKLRTPQDQDTPSTMTAHRTVAHSQ